MDRGLKLVLALVLGISCGGGRAPVVAQEPAATPSPADAERDARLRGEIAPLLSRYCTECHGERRKRAGINLVALGELSSLSRERQTWEKVMRMLSTREMPPEDKPQPTEVERRALVAWLQAELSRVDCSGSVDPGRVTLRRLTRVEYRNTVRDLLGVDFDAEKRFPADEVGYGFDNIGDVLSISPLLFEKFLAAAEEVAARAIAADLDPPAPKAEPRVLRSRPSDGTSAAASTAAIFSRLGALAYRRPLRAGELEPIVAIVDRAMERGVSFTEAVEEGLVALLASPRFLYHVEEDPAGAIPGTAYALDGYALASRLSYFLWSSAPDAELLDLAAAGRLDDDAVLTAQVARLLDDPRAVAFAENFAGQWLGTRFLDSISPDPKLFPGFDAELRAAMREETLRYFFLLIAEDRSLLDLIDSDFVVINERLARHYGIDGVRGPGFRRVPVGDSGRGGVLTQASVLAVTSNPTRTSPVKRGLWVLDQILGEPPPPPPPDVPALKEDGEAVLSGSLRQRMEKHRADPSCSVCHRSMDAIGFAFENFDALGSWREFDGSFLVDAAGMLPDGSSFDGPSGLKQVLGARKRELTRALARKSLTYALGRGLEPSDGCAVEEIVDTVEKSGYKLRRLLSAVARSQPFRMRRAE